MELKIIDEVKAYAKDMSVLYVEDEPSIRDEVVKFLEKIFKVVSVAKDGQEGLECYSKKEYDIVISDIEMPILNGIEMVEEIKKINKDQIIAVFSGYNDKEYLLKLINLGANVFVLKPFDLEDFFKAIHKVVKNKYEN